MVVFRAFWVGMLACFLSLAASAVDLGGDVAHKVAVQPLPTWVVRQQYDPARLDDEPTNGASYLLLSYQRWHDDADEHYYSRIARKVVDMDGAEDVSQLSVSFDPSFETLAFHHVRVIRDGTVQDRLDLSDIQLLHNETEAARLIYNGTVTASLILSDVRPGDIVDYAYTVSGKNPVFHGHISDRSFLGFSVPIGRRFVRINVPDDRVYWVKQFAGAPEPVQLRDGGRRVYEWAADYVGRSYEDDAEPYWFPRYPRVDLTDLADWTALGEHYSPFYRLPETVSEDLLAEIEAIRRAHADDAARVRAALKLVQSNVRYLGMENGVGGYAPRDASQVWDQRFGDCKDKTMLLATILDRLGIKAVPVLVDTKSRRHFELDLPSSITFDHVIIQVELGDETVWFDPTRNDQTGDWSHIQQAEFGAGVTIAGNDSGLVEIPLVSRPSEYGYDVTETFDTVRQEGKVYLQVETRIWGHQADDFLSWKRREGIEGISKEYLKYYQNEYKSIELEKPIQVTENPSAGSIHIQEFYLIPHGWTKAEEKNREELSAWPSQVRDALPDEFVPDRSSPVHLGTPSRRRHELVFKLDDDWSLDDEEVVYDLPAFFYSKKAHYDGSIYREVYEYRGKQDNIAIADLKEASEALDIIWDGAGVTLYREDAAVETVKVSPKSSSAVKVAGGIAQALVSTIEKAVIMITIAVIGFLIFLAVRLVRSDRR